MQKLALGGSALFGFYAGPTMVPPAHADGAVSAATVTRAGKKEEGSDDRRNVDICCLNVSLLLLSRCLIWTSCHWLKECR